jgi:hypothetical protein
MLRRSFARALWGEEAEDRRVNRVEKKEGGEGRVAASGTGVGLNTELSVSYFPTPAWARVVVASKVIRRRAIWGKEREDI